MTSSETSDRIPRPSALSRPVAGAAPHLLKRLFLICSGATPEPDIPHRAPDLDAFLTIEPGIPLAQQLEQVLVLVGQIQNHESLAWDIEHMNPHEIVKHPACGRVLDALAFLVRKGGRMLLEGGANAIL